MSPIPFSEAKEGIKHKGIRMTRYRLFLAIIFIHGVLATHAQSPQTNLAKYWHYRNMLKTDFLVDGDPETMGHYMPAGNRHEINDYMQWGDGTWWMGHYLCVLATEYRLLKDNNQDLTETETELENLLQSINRLDLEAETFFGGVANLNGFFLRDDVPANFHTHFPGINTIISDFTSGSSPGLMSQDQVWSLLVGLALTKKLVDDPVFNQEAKDIAFRIVDAMNYVNSNGIPVWEIINPVTGEVVQSNSDIGFLRYGFAESATWISGQNAHFGSSNSSIAKASFQSAQDIILVFEDFQKFNVFGIEALSAVGNINFTSYGSLYDWLVHVYDETQFHIHFPLVHQLLHGFDGTDMIEEPVIVNLLNSAPYNGPFYYDENNHSPPPWDKINLIANSWQNTSWFPGRYSGLDYMLLYNLWFLVYNNQPVPYRNITPEFPLETDWMEFSAGQGSQQSPVTIETARRAEAGNVIQANGHVTYITGGSIVLKQGFHAKQGSYFKAVRDTTLAQPIYYKKIEPNPDELTENIIQEN